MLSPTAAEKDSSFSFGNRRNNWNDFHGKSWSIKKLFVQPLICIYMHVYMSPQIWFLSSLYMCIVECYFQVLSKELKIMLATSFNSNLQYIVNIRRVADTIFKDETYVTYVLKFYRYFFIVLYYLVRIWWYVWANNMHIWI